MQYLLSIFGVLIILGVIIYYYFQKKGGFSGATFSRGGTPALDSFSRDFTDFARKGKMDPVIGRDQEIDQLAIILSRRTKNNALLIGEAGVGKTTIVEGLAQNIVTRKVPAVLNSKRVLALDLNALVAGTKYRGEFESRIKRMIEEIERAQRSIILFIDEFHNVLAMEDSGESLSVGDILKPAMARGELQVIGATTPLEYQKYLQADPALRRRLQPLFVEEPSEQETLRILRGVKKKYEEFHEVRITDLALQKCIEQSKKILPDRAFPDKAIDLMDEAASKVKLTAVKRARKRAVSVQARDIIDVAGQYARTVSVRDSRMGA